MMEQLTLWINGHQAHVFYLLFAGSFLFNRLPFVGVFFRTVNTLLHESGHAIGAIVTSGEVVRIDINRDTSGIAETRSKGRFSAFIVSFAGYPFAAFLSSLLLIMVINDQHKIVAFILLSLMILNLMLFVRNIYGIIWLVLFSGLLIVAVSSNNDLALKTLILFVCLISFTETFVSTMLITFLGLMKPKKAGDLSNMQKSSGIPAGLWAIIMCSIVMWVLYYTVVNYFPDVKLLFG